MIQRDELLINYISTKEKLTDSLTNPTNIENFRKHIYALGLRAY